MRKKWAWPGVGKLPKILGFPYNISATAGASDFNIITQLGFAKVRHKYYQKNKSMWPWAREAPKRLGVAL